MGKKQKKENNVDTKTKDYQNEDEENLLKKYFNFKEFDSTKVKSLYFNS